MKIRQFLEFYLYFEFKTNMVQHVYKRQLSLFILFKFLQLGLEAELELLG